MDLGLREFEPYFKALLVEAHHAAGEAVVGLKVVEDAMRFAKESEVCFWDAGLLLLKGKLLACMSQERDHKEVEDCYREALAVARRQQARSLELRAAASLTRLCRDQGRRAEARALLEPVYAWFSEGFDTPDLRDAKALLDESLPE
jgi:predicted ATPase